MPAIPSLPQTPDRTGPTRPPRSTSSTGRTPASPAAFDALADAAALTDLVRDARGEMVRYIGGRRRAVLAAHQGGLSIRRIAASLGVSIGAVQNIIADAARPAAR